MRRDANSHKKREEELKCIKRIRNYISSGNFEKALEVFNYNFGPSTNNITALIEYGKILSFLQRYDESEEVLFQVLSKNLKDYDKSYVYYNLGEMYYYKNDYPKAKEAYLKCASFKNENSRDRALFQLYKVTRVYDIEEAMIYLEEVASSKNERNSNFINLAKVTLAEKLIANGNRSQIERAIKLLKDVDFNFIRNKYPLYYIIYLIDNAKIQSLYYKNMVSSVSYLDMAENFYNEKFKNNKAYNKYIGQIYRNRAIIESNTDNHENAIYYNASYLRAVNVTYVKKNKVLLSIARSLINLSEFDRAEKLIKAVNKRDKIVDDEVNKLSTQLDILLSFRKYGYEKTLPMMEKLYEEDNCNAETLYYLCCAYIHFGQIDKADVVFQKLLKENEIINSYGTESKISKLYTYLSSCKGEIISGYLSHQIYNYNAEEAKMHIKKHYLNNKNFLCFNKDISIDELFDYLQENISEENFIVNNITDIHIIEYKNAGYDGNDTFDYITVAVLPGTKNIITAYPTNNQFGEGKIDYDDDNEETEQIKPKERKRLSQVEKFNNKYNLNN